MRDYSSTAKDMVMKMAVMSHWHRDSVTHGHVLLLLCVGERLEPNKHEDDVKREHWQGANRQ